MDPTTPVSDFNRLAQYGAAGIVAAGLLTLVVVIFRQLITHALEQNKQLTERQHDMQAKTLEALHALGQALRDLDANLRSWKTEITYSVVEMVRDEATAAGSRAHRTKPPSR